MKFIGDPITGGDRKGNQRDTHRHSTGQAAANGSHREDGKTRIGPQVSRLVGHLFRQRRDVHIRDEEDRRHVRDDWDPEPEVPGSTRVGARQDGYRGSGYNSQPIRIPAPTNPPNRRAPNLICSIGSSRVSTANTTETNNEKITMSPR